MLRYALGRLVEMVPVLLGTALLVFSMIHLVPGDPALLIAGLEASPQTIERAREQFGLDRPLPVQFWRFLAGAMTGDLGMSFRTGSPVVEEIVDRFGHTFIIALGATLLATAAGMLAGTIAAVRRNRLADGVVMVMALVAVSTPSYWLALMLMLCFSLWWGLLPSIGVATPWHYVLPIVTLGAQSAGIIARMTRSAMLDVLAQEYVATARAKGVAEGVVIVRHALRNALVPVLSVVGLRFGGLLAGTVLVESVFAIPGLGRLIVDAVLLRDYPMVQGAVLVVATLFIVVNALTDILYTVVDPRVRLA